MTGCPAGLWGFIFRREKADFYQVFACMPQKAVIYYLEICNSPMVPAGIRAVAITPCIGGTVRNEAR